MSRTSWLLCLFILIFVLFLFHFRTLTLYPTASIDESWISSDAIAMVDKNFINMDYPFFVKNAGFSYFPKLTYGLFYKWAGLGLTQGRTLNLILSLLFLIILALFVSRFFDNKTALLSIVFFSSTTTFLFSSHLIRFDIPFTVMLLISLWLFFLYYQTRKFYYSYFSGLILGFSYEVQMNGILFQVSFILTLLLFGLLQKKLNIKALICFILGIIIYWIFYTLIHILPDVQNFSFTSNYMFNVDHPVPLLSLPIKQIILTEAGRYVSNYSNGGIFELIATIIALIWALKQNNNLLRFISFYIISILIMFLLLASNKAFFYFIYVLPLISILFSKIVLSFLEIRKNKIAICFLIIIGINYLRQFFIIKNNYYYDYQEINKSFSPYFGNNSLILGEAHYFLPLKDYRYSNIILLTWYRLYNNLNAYQTLSKINPDFIITDAFIEGRLVDNEDEIKNRDFQRGLHKVSKKEFTKFLDEKTILVKTINSKYYFGDINLYKVLK